MSIEIFQSTSLEYVRVPISAFASGIAVDPTGDTVQMTAEQVSDAAGIAGWHSASWETDTTTTPDTYYAKFLIGPGSSIGALTAGLYNVFVKISDSPETPVKQAGVIKVV